MPGALTKWMTVAAFAVSLGHLIWGTYWDPAPRDYFVGGDVSTLMHPDPGANQIYLRRMIYFRERPRHAWLKVLAKDSVSVFVNGESLGRSHHQGFSVALVLDLTPYLRGGENVIAISATQITMDSPPMAAVEGEYWLSDGGHLITVNDEWRCHSSFEWKARWWFEPEFDDRHWISPIRQDHNLRVKMVVPPRSTTTPSTAKWVTGPSNAESCVAMRRELNLNNRPSSAWMRITSNAHYTLAINGSVIDTQTSTLGTPLPPSPSRRKYDVTSFLHQGRNVVTVKLKAPSGVPALLADFEIEDADGNYESLGTDERWTTRRPASDEWLIPNDEETSSWKPCLVESGDLGTPPWLTLSQGVVLSTPAEILLPRQLSEFAVIFAVALVTSLLCACVEYGRTASVEPSPNSPEVFPKRRDLLTYYPLVLTSLGIVAGILATFDRRVGRQDVFNELWVMASIASVLIQWVFLIVAQATNVSNERCCFDSRSKSFLTAILLLGILALGFWMRIRQITNEPVQIDEAYQSIVTDGFRERHFPSRRLEPEQPVIYMATSELVHLVLGFVSYVTDSGKLINRAPSALWGTLTILVLYLAGHRMFGRAAGLLAAAICATSDHCIRMSNWGRYPSQIHFMAIVTVYCYWRTLEGNGTVSRRWLWLATISFLLTYFTWEASALMALAMILAALLTRRGSIHAIVCDRHVWMAIAVVTMAALAQYSHRQIQQSHRFYLGWGDTKVTVTPMWLYPAFDPFGYLRQAVWNKSILLPMSGFVGAIAIAARQNIRKPALFVTIICAGTCLTMSLLMSISANRMIFHMVPPFILLSAAAFASAIRFLQRFCNGAGKLAEMYVNITLGAASVGLVILGSGLTLELPGRAGNISGETVDGKTFPDYDTPIEFVRQHWQEGDVVLTDFPSAVIYRLREFVPDPNALLYCVQTCQRREAVLSDQHLIPAHRMDGTIMISSLDSLEDVFAKHRRIWFVCSRLCFFGGMNDKDVYRFTNENMTVVFESHTTAVLLRWNQHRTAEQRMLDRGRLKTAETDWSM